MIEENIHIKMAFIYTFFGGCLAGIAYAALQIWG